MQAEASAHTPSPRWGFCSFMLAADACPPMSDEDATHLHVIYADHLDMDGAFCIRMRAAIAAGLESAQVGVVTMPGTKNPKYVPTELPPLASSLSDRDFV